MAKAVKMMDVTAFGRMAKMQVVVKEAGKDSALKSVGQVFGEAMHQAAEAELNTQPRSKYRKSLMN